MMLHVIGWALLGGICGWIAGSFVNSASTNQSRQLVMLGVFAGVIGGYIGTSIIPGTGADDLGGSSMMAVGSAIGLLWLRIYLQDAQSKGESQKMDNWQRLQTSRSSSRDADDKNAMNRRGDGGMRS